MSRQRAAKPIRSLDEIDRAILKRLSEDARISGRKLGQEVGLKHTAVYERLEKLENSGYILKYTFISDRKTVGFIALGYIRISVIKNNKQSMDEISEFLLSIRNVIMCESTLGEYDILVKIGYKDSEEFDNVHDLIRSHHLCDDTETIMCVKTLREHHIGFSQLL